MRKSLLMAMGVGIGMVLPSLSGTQAMAASRDTPYYWAWWGWEPLEHNVRLGGPSASVDGSAWWAPAWYDRLHGEALAREMSGLGINLAVTHFYKGFGLEAEKPQWQRTAEFVRLAHREGIKVIGYCQFGSLYYETFLAEEPKAETWSQRDVNGGLKTYEGQQYYRWRPCFNHPDFRAYLKRAVRVGLEDVKLDGFNFDNCVSYPCYCERCTALFRVWLAKRYPEPQALFGIPNFDHVRQPPAPAKLGRVDDPLIRAWIRWRCEVLGVFMGEIADAAHSLRPDVILMANPSHPCGAGDTVTRSVWPVWIGRHLDMMITENANSPELDGELMVSQIRAHKNAAAVGYRAVPTSWAAGAKYSGSSISASRLPQTPDEIRLQIAEAAANGGIPGANWALRAAGGGAAMRVDRPELREALGSCLTFVRRHEALICPVRPVCDVAVLHAFPSFAFDARYASDQTAAFEEVLIRAGFSWGVVFDDDLGALSRSSVLVLAGQTHLSDAVCTAVKAFSERGGGVVLLGDNAAYDDEGRLQEKNRLEEIKGERVRRLEACEIRKTGRDWGVFALLPPTWKAIADAVSDTGAGRFSARLVDPDATVSLNVCQPSVGGRAVHLVNYAVPRQTRPLRVEISAMDQPVRSVRLLTPEASERTLTPRIEGKQAVFEVPPFAVYVILVVE